MRIHGWQFALFLVFFSSPAWADTLLFNSGSPDGRMAVASRPESTGKFEIEAADDFVLTTQSLITSATFTGLLSGGSTLGSVGIEIYRVFPLDSNVARTSGPPTFSTPMVPTRVNSPSDVAFAERESGGGGLSFSTTVLAGNFTALSSVLNGINPKPGQTTGGEGPVSGQEVGFDVT